jgi:hypothetical protein
MPKTQSSDKPQAVELLKSFLLKNKINLRLSPLKTYTDNQGRLVVEPPTVEASYMEEPKQKS